MEELLGNGEALRHDHRQRRADQHQDLEEPAEAIHHEGAVEGGTIAADDHRHGGNDQQQCRQGRNEACTLLTAVSAEQEQKKGADGQENFRSGQGKIGKCGHCLCPQRISGSGPAEAVWPAASIAAWTERRSASREAAVASSTGIG